MKIWSQPLRVETPEFAVLCTIRTINSALWFINNRDLESHILGYLAKYSIKYNVILHNFAIQGNHLHLVARFPDANRSAFMRDFNARVAEGVRKYAKGFPGGPVFERRYTSNILPLQSDVEHYFFYSGLQAVQDGLSERLSEYPGYNGIYDALRERTRKFKVVRWGEYSARKRFNPDIHIRDFTNTYELKFSRVPGYNCLTPKDYEKQMLKKLEVKRLKEVVTWKAKGHSFPTKDILRRIKPGSLPYKTKQGTRRPIVLCACYETRKQILAWYFQIVEMYLNASKRFRLREADIDFPPLTYPPPQGLVPA